MRQERDSTTQIVVALGALAPMAVAMALVGVRDHLQSATAQQETPPGAGRPSFSASTSLPPLPDPEGRTRC